MKPQPFVRGMVTALLAGGGFLAGCSGAAAPLATVNGEPVTRQEFDAYLKLKRLPVTEKDSQRYATVLDQYLQRKALAIAIEQRLDRGDPAEAARLQAEFDEFRREQLISRYFEQHLAAAVTDDAVDRYYKSHAAEFSERRAHIAHILVRASRGMGEAQRRTAQARIDEAASRLSAGMDWATAVERYSEDASTATKAGDLGWIQEGAIDPKLSQVAFQLAEGKVSGPFETQFGFHIVKVLEAPAIRPRPLESVKGEIRYRLRGEAKAAELRKLADSVSVKKTS